MESNITTVPTIISNTTGSKSNITTTIALTTSTADIRSRSSLSSQEITSTGTINITTTLPPLKNTPKLSNELKRTLIIAVPVSLISLAILIVVALFIAKRCRKRASMNLQDYIYDDSVAASKVDGAVPVFINRAYSRDDDYLPSAGINLDDD